MANNNLFTFRCPADLREKIEAESSATGKDKTAVVVGMLRQSLPCLSLYERNTLPPEPGIYLVYQGNRLLYIGQTVNLLQRLTTHHRGKQFKAMGDDVQVAWFLCDEDEDLPVIEKSLIDLLDPELNDQPGAPGTTNAIRVTAYVKPATAEKLKEYQEQHEVGVSQAIDQILGEYFAGERISVTAPEMEATPPSDWLALVKEMIEERVAGLESRLEEYEPFKADEALRPAAESDDREQVLTEGDRLDERVSDLLLENENLRGELNECRQQQVTPANCESNWQGLLSEARSQVLTRLKLGKQAPGYKAAVKALDLFVDLLEKSG